MIGIHIGTAARGIGGAEYSVAVLAEDLCRTGQVEIVHHKSTFTSNQLAEFSGTDLRTLSKEPL